VVVVLGGGGGGGQKLLFSSPLWGPHSLLGCMIWIPPGSKCEEYRRLECGALHVGRDLPLLRGSPLPASSEPLRVLYE